MNIDILSLTGGMVPMRPQAALPDASGVAGVLPNTYWLLSAALFVSAALVGLLRTQ